MVNNCLYILYTILFFARTNICSLLISISLKFGINIVYLILYFIFGFKIQNKYNLYNFKQIRRNKHIFCSNMGIWMSVETINEIQTFYLAKTIICIATKRTHTKHTHCTLTTIIYNLQTTMALAACNNCFIYNHFFLCTESECLTYNIFDTIMQSTNAYFSFSVM